MNLKQRFSLVFALLIAIVVTVFSIVVYDSVKAHLMAAANASLTDRMEHQWKHIQFHHEHPSEPHNLTQTREVMQRIWKNGALIYDTFPQGVELTSAANTVELQNGKIVHSIQREFEGNHYELLGVYDLTAMLHFLSELSGVLALGCFSCLIFIFPIGWLATHVLLRPFRVLALKTGELGAEQLSFRFPEPLRKDEYGVLIQGFNSLLTRLEKSFRQIRRFASNASHELRTPLTIIRTEAELTLRRPRTTADYEAALATVLTQAQNLQRIVGQLLVLSEVERVEGEAPRVPIEVTKTLQETVRSVSKLLGGIEKKVELTSDPGVVFRGHFDLFSSVVRNLVENAVKYSDSVVRIECRKDPSGLHLRFDDDGMGMTDADKEEAFEPFFRGSSHNAEGKKFPGYGLGLSIVKACVDAERGTIELHDSPLGGLSVEVLLPEAR